MSRRKKKGKKNRKRRITKRRAVKEEPRIPASAEAKWKLFHSMKFLYTSFAFSFAFGYVGPALLDATFSKFLNSAAIGASVGVVCALLVFGVLHALLALDREVAEDLLDAITVSRFSHFHASLFGVSLGMFSGLIYPLTARSRPFTGGKSIDDLFGHFLWAPIGAVFTFGIATTWCFARRAAQKTSVKKLSKLKMQSWMAAVMIAVGAWLLFVVADLFPQHRSGIDLEVPHAWISILPLFVIFIGIGAALSLAVKQTRVAQAARDRAIKSIDELTEPIEIFASHHGMKRLVEWAPNWLRIVPTGGMQIFGWFFMGCAIFVFSFVCAIAWWAPHLSDGAEFPLLIITPFFVIGLSCVTLPWRFTFDGNKKEVRFGNLWTCRQIPFDSIQAVQIINASSWQLNLITNDENEPRIHVWDHDKETTRLAAKRLEELLKVDVIRVEQ